MSKEEILALLFRMGRWTTEETYGKGTTLSDEDIKSLANNELE
jgi:hypothetical protein